MASCHVDFLLGVSGGLGHRMSGLEDAGPLGHTRDILDAQRRRD
jgi:hypothetical protein